MLTHLTLFTVANSSSNPGITCGPLCVSSVTIRVVPSTICVYPQDMGLCGIVAATNIQSNGIQGYGNWSCNTGGVTTSTPCVAPVWPGITCTGIYVVSLSFAGVTGKR